MGQLIRRCIPEKNDTLRWYLPSFPLYSDCGACYFIDVCCLVTTVVFLGVVWPSGLLSGAGGVISALLPDDVEEAVAGSSTVVEGEASASESLSVVTPSVVESVLDVAPAAVPSSVEQMSSVVVGVSPSAGVHALGPEVERLNVASLAPGPVDVCMGTAAIVVDDCITAAVGPIDVAVQTEGGLCVFNEHIDHVKDCVLCNTLGWLHLAILPYFR